MVKELSEVREYAKAHLSDPSELVEFMRCVDSRSGGPTTLGKETIWLGSEVFLLDSEESARRIFDLLSAYSSLRAN